MLAIHYEGWCQVRLASNPDPSDEPRGVSGYSFALAGEPDLDRAIRFQDPVSPRPLGPEVGVRVTQVVSRGGDALAEHPLLGADVVLLNEDGEPPASPRDPRGPRFEARGYILADPGDEPLWPYHIRFEKGDISVARKAEWGGEWAGQHISDVPLEELKRFGAVMEVFSADVAAATGITDYIAFREQRREEVRALHENADDPVEKAALARRLSELEKSPNQDKEDPVGSDRRTIALGGIQKRNFPITGDATIVDPSGELGDIDTNAPWQTSFWFGGWDCDTLCSYVKGLVVVPFKGFPPG